MIAALLLLQFYVASYSHKMIGLETVQVVQLFYFSRMIIQQQSTSILNSLNVLKYSNGYSNPDILFSSSSSSLSASEKYSTVAEPFLSIDLEKYFLLDVNVSLLPLLIAGVAYFLYLVRKYSAKNNYLESRKQEERDRFTILKRSTQWVYDHFVFPYLMMFLFIAFFSTIMFLQSSDS